MAGDKRVPGEALGLGPGEYDAQPLPAGSWLLTHVARAQGAGAAPGPAGEPPPQVPSWLRALQQVTGYSWATLLSPRMETAHWEKDLGVTLRKRERALQLLAVDVPLDAATLERLRQSPTVAGWRRVLGGEARAPGNLTDLARSRGFDPSLLTEERVTKELLDAVVEKTGYDRSQLHLDADLEADLGIDSVKQAQILGHLRRKYPVEFRGGLRLKDFPTLRSWVKFVMAAAKGGELQRLAGPTLQRSARVLLREQVEWVAEVLPAAGERALAKRWRVVAVGEGPLPAAFTSAWAEATAEGDGAAEGVLLWVGTGPAGPGVAEALWPALAQLRALRTDGGLQVLGLGTGGREGADESPLFAAASGALKSLAAEDGRVQVSLLRLQPGLLEARPQACAHAAAEELQRGQGLEAALDGEGRRHVRRAFPADLALAAAEAWLWPARPRVLVTGGARGIAAKVALQLAERLGARLLLVGRSAPETAEVQATLEAVRAAGGEATYLSEDVAADGAAARVLQHAAAAWDGLDAVFHAAGVIEDAPLEEKTGESFARVLSPKVTGLERLLEAAERLPCFPGAWVGFSSIVAWRGNARQVDYAAANEAMAALLRSRAAPRGARVRVLDFGAWDEVGMAERSGLARVLREAGEGLVGVADGTEALLMELAYGPASPVESTWLAGPAELSPVADFPAEETGPLRPGTGLLDRVARGPRHLEGKRTLSVERDLWLKDHSIFEDPVMPGSMGLELLVEAARALLPGYAWAGLRDFAIQSAVALMGVKTLELTVRASASLAAGAGLRAVRCQLELPGGRPCYEATVLMSRGTPGWPEPRVLAPAQPPGDLPLSAAPALYERIRLGPAFHLLEEARTAPAVGGQLPRAWARTAPLPPARFFHPGMVASDFAAAPLLLEAGFHAAAWLRLQLSNSVVVPRAIRALRAHAPHDAARAVQWVVVERAVGVFDLQAWQDGRLVLEVQGYETFDVTAISSWLSAGTQRAGEAA
jgi:NAD(P)-dependent dehydrogenase (short-subunit alcohol dehydrogenase family)/acyl carrier protein